jgi:adenylylsulfate kinase
MYHEKIYRTLLKTISWRFLATLTTFLLVLLFTKKLEIALSIGALEALIKAAVYYFHERIWDKIKKGRSEIKPKVIWLTGLSGSGKSTIAEDLKNKLDKKGIKNEILDGDIIRSILPKTGFSKEDRIAHNKRIGLVASLLEKNGVTAIVAVIAPYEESREFVRSICKNYIEVYISTSLEVCEKRDVKGLYKKVRNGEIKNFTGIDDPYEIPKNPNLVINTFNEQISQSSDKILKIIKL